jgi:glycerol-3-phosphate acyltransferase PlsY
MIYLISYLCGSVLFGVIAAKLLKINNIREKGSGNVGATNLARVSGKRSIGALVAILDALKGAIPILLGRKLELDGESLATVGMMAVIGHIFPVWYGFKGGKGVAVFIGVNLALDWKIGCLMGIIWCAIFLITKISSVSSLVMVISCAIAYLWKLDQLWQITVCTIMISIAHRENIKRLLSGKENKIG